MLLIAALAVEVFITLADFIEEDMSRKLPASERVNHTLLAINYGAILVLALPVLVGVGGRAGRDQARVAHGYWSALMVFAAFGAVVFGARDLLASRRPDPVVDAGRGSRRRAAAAAERAGHRRDRLHRPPSGAGADHRRS